jgi:putative transposase
MDTEPSLAVVLWKRGCSNDVQLSFIRPGRPVENGFIESLNGRLRNECFNVEWFVSLTGARQKVARFRQHYNHKRPYSARADRTPAGFAKLDRRATKKLVHRWGA